MDPVLIQRIREKSVETLVHIEHFEFFSTPDGLYLFGNVLEVLGAVVQAVAMGRRDHALNLMCSLETSLTPLVPEAGSQRERVQECLQGFLSVVEVPDLDEMH